MQTRDRNLLKIAIKIAISAALMGWLLSKIDSSALSEGLSQTSLYVLISAFIILLALSVAQTCRWVLVARTMGVRLTFLKAWSISLIGLFFNQTLPSSIGGDAVRVWRLKRAGFQVGLSIRTVLLDRLVALFGLVVIATIGLPALMGWIGNQPLRWVVPFLIACGYAGFFCLLLIDTAPIRKLLSGKLTDEIVGLGHGARVVFLHPACIVPTLSLSLFIHAGVCAVVFLLALDLGAEITFWQMLVLFPPVLLITLVPFSIAGWGIREGAMITALGFVGVPPVTAFSISILFGIVMVAVGVAGGIVWLATGRQRPVVENETNL
ncbi:MAG: hypothetical protein CMM55_04810 [Rhodospirillaceae bacterium]|nr:hypothetical protein [Rhodospirillaceae bacterium]